MTLDGKIIGFFPVVAGVYFLGKVIGCGGDEITDPVDVDTQDPVSLTKGVELDSLGGLRLEELDIVAFELAGLQSSMRSAGAIHIPLPTGINSVVVDYTSGEIAGSQTYDRVGLGVNGKSVVLEDSDLNGRLVSLRVTGTGVKDGDAVRYSGNGDIQVAMQYANVFLDDSMLVTVPEIERFKWPHNRYYELTFEGGDVTSDTYHILVQFSPGGGHYQGDLNSPNNVFEGLSPNMSNPQFTYGSVVVQQIDIPSEHVIPNDSNILHISSSLDRPDTTLDRVVVSNSPLAGY
tara:strand:- start:13347 stop:14216 length:870 start_codon:yes stop_codon:yes gene_type:complete